MEIRCNQYVVVDPQRPLLDMLCLATAAFSVQVATTKLGYSVSHRY